MHYHQAVRGVVAWLWQSGSKNNRAIGLALSQFLDGESGDLLQARWPWRPFKSFGPTRRLVDIWAPVDEGGLSEPIFEFFTRFEKEEVKRLAIALNIPTAFDYNRKGYPNAQTTSPEEALAVFLWRSAHPLALGYLIVFFGKSRPWLSRVFNGVLTHIWEKWGRRIELDSRVLLTPQRIDQYATAIGESLGAADESIFGFIDGTELPVCRPMVEDQSFFYSGHKKQHAICHMAIMLPNGLFGAVFAGIPAAGGDASQCIQIGLGEKLRQLLSYLPPGDFRFVYGDAAFGSQDFVLGPYKRANNRILTPTQKQLNQWLSTKRVVVEHGFGGVKSLFKFLSLKTSIRAGTSPIGIYLPVLAFIYNCRTCIKGGNQISNLFGIAPLTLEEYVGEEESSDEDSSMDD
jgi:hypothetical protein